MHTRLTREGRAIANGIWMLCVWCFLVPVGGLLTLTLLGAIVTKLAGDPSANRAVYRQPQPIYPLPPPIVDSNPTSWNSTLMYGGRPLVTARVPQSSRFPALVLSATTRPISAASPPQQNHGLVYNMTSGFAPGQQTQRTGFVYPTGFNSGHQSGSHK